MVQWFNNRMNKAYDDVFAHMQQTRASLEARLYLQEVGTVLSVSTGIAIVSGLPDVGFEELLQFPKGIYGIAFSLDQDEIGVVLLGNYFQLNAGDEVLRTNRVMDIAVGEALIGRVIDPLGRVLDGKEPPILNKRMPIERPAPPILSLIHI